MLDDLRNSSTFEEEEPQQPPETPVVQPHMARRKRGPFLGMTPSQRFFLALMLFMMVCVLGVGALLLTGAMVLP